MQGSIVQIAALTAYGNHLLRGHALAESFRASQSFMHCKSVSFVTLEMRNGAAARDAYAGDPVQWFARLREEGVRGLRLHWRMSKDAALNDRMSAAFIGGGGRWLIEAIKPATSSIWEARWDVGDRNDPQRKVWQVTYGRTIPTQPHIHTARENTHALHDSLETALIDIAAFADRQQRVSQFARIFRSGLETLRAERPLDDEVFAHYAPRQALSLAGQQLLAAAYTSWVFGGMGSWNDENFPGPDQAIYETLSARLFTTLNEAIVVGVNSSCDAQQTES